jgi:hypothetical protein
MSHKGHWKRGLRVDYVDCGDRIRIALFRLLNPHCAGIRRAPSSHRAPARRKIVAQAAENKPSRLKMAPPLVDPPSLPPRVACSALCRQRRGNTVAFGITATAYKIPELFERLAPPGHGSAALPRLALAPAARRFLAPKGLRLLEVATEASLVPWPYSLVGHN